jgi:hypothetical protein
MADPAPDCPCACGYSQEYSVDVETSRRVARIIIAKHCSDWAVNTGKMPKSPHNGLVVSRVGILPSFLYHT